MADLISATESPPLVLSEIQSGEGLSLSAAGRMFPAHRGEGTLNPSTIFRWVVKGANGADGKLVRLEAVRVGSRWLTSRGAVARFVAALTPAAPTPVDPTRPTTPTLKARHKACNRAAMELKRRGA